MKRWRTIILMLFAFVVGFASTFSCGSGVPSVIAAGDADTLQGHPAAYFALSVHSHPEYATIALLSSHTHDGGDIIGTIDADLLEGRSAIDFAESIHVHPRFEDLSGNWIRKEIVMWIDGLFPSGVDAGYDEVEVEIIHSGNTLSFITSNKPYDSLPEQMDVTINSDNFSYHFYTNAPGEHYDYQMNGVIISGTSITGHTVIAGHGVDDGDEFIQWIYQKQ